MHAGLQPSADDKQVVLRTAEGKDIVIPRGEVDEMTEAKRSLMPDGVVGQLSFQEFIDLIAFLKDRPAQESLRTMLTEAWVVAGADGSEIEKAATASIDPLQGVKATDGKQLTWQLTWRRGFQRCRGPLRFVSRVAKWRKASVFLGVCLFAQGAD